MVDALVSGASAARRAGSSPVLGTETETSNGAFPSFALMLFPSQPNMEQRRQKTGSVENYLSTNLYNHEFI